MNEIKSVLGHVNTDLFGYNAVLFVEGNSEVKTIPLLASNLGIDIVNEVIRIMDSEGYGNMIQIKNIIDLLKDNGTEVYALFDNHAKQQGKLNDIKIQLNKENYVELEKGFEDSFSNELLIIALRELLDERHFELDESDVSTIKDDLKSKNAYDVLNNIYYAKTNNTLSKVVLGEHIANLIKGKPSLQLQSKAEMLIKRIHDKVIQQMNLGIS